MPKLLVVVAGDVVKMLIF